MWSEWFRGWNKMGCSSSKTAKGSQPVKQAQKPVKAPVDKSKLDPKDFIIVKKTGETIVKQEGTINGQQFSLEELKDCDIFLLDYIATINIDYCENCRIFVGPVESSVFIRNCNNCSVILACQQFRCRDCTDCRIALLSTTEPIIETSVDMKFACFDFFYFSLREQLASANLRPVNNKWWQVHDFNANADKPNWSLLPQDDVCNLLRTSQCTSISEEEISMDRVVPVTLGSRPLPCEECCFILFLPEQEALVEGFLSKASKMEGCHICRTRSMVVPEDRLKSLFAFTAKEKLEKQIQGREIVGIDVCGQGIRLKVEESLNSLSSGKGSPGFRIVPESTQTAMAKAFFEVWKDEI